MRELRGGKYTLLRTLGEGTQAETWEARANDDDGARSRPDPARLASDFDAYVRRAKGGAIPNPRGLVAIKCFRIGKAKAWKDVELAEREASTLATLDHPNLPRYLEHFEEEGALYLVMEKIEGEGLAPGKTKDVDVVRMMRDVGAALRYLHGRTPSLVHRDVKPGNIIRRPDGSYVLVDLGAVRDRLKPAGGSTVVGTFGYMAPEQFQGRASPQSDLYGLAATALAMLTGRQPEELPHEGLGIDVKASLPRGTSRALSKTLAAMLAPDPDRRLESIDEALTMLEGARAPKEKKTPRRQRRARKPRKPRAPRAPRPPRTISGIWHVLRVVVVVTTIMAWLTMHTLVPFWVGLPLLVLIGIAAKRERSAPPKLRVAEQERESDRVRVADELEPAEEEEEEEARDRLRR